MAVWFIELPVAWLIVQQTSIGPVGTTYGAIAGMLARLFIYVPYFKWGRWTRIKVF